MLEMCSSIHRTPLSLQHMIQSTSHRTRLVKMSTKIYNSITHHMVLMLIIMTHWTSKHEQNSQHFMTPYHHLRKITVRRITSM